LGRLRNSPPVRGIATPHRDTCPKSTIKNRLDPLDVRIKKAHAFEKYELKFALRISGM
jgi:hypothetical protein